MANFWRWSKKNKRDFRKLISVRGARKVKGRDFRRVTRAWEPFLPKKNDCMVYKIMESNRTGRVKLWVLKELEF